MRGRESSNSTTMSKCKKLILQAMLLCLVLEASLVSGEKHVRLLNGLFGSEELRVHCKSGNDDLGMHILYPGQDFNWGFHSFVNTLFYCYAFWRNKQLSFDSYNYRRDKNVCGDCRWQFATEGVYFYDWAVNDYFLRYPWQN